MRINCGLSSFFMHPKLKFKIDYKRDIETFFAFNNEADFDDGRNLKWAILRKYPQFKKYKKNNKLDISKKWSPILLGLFI